MAAAISPLEEAAPTPVPRIEVVARPDDADAAQTAVEHHMFRAVLVGMAIGSLVCVALWELTVFVALVPTGQPLMGPMLMAAVVGVFAGVFFGGWAGTLYGAHLLEEHEKTTRPRVPEPAR
jgi:hypothetical protein